MVRRVLFLAVVLAAAFAGSGRYQGDALAAVLRTATHADVQLARSLHDQRGIHFVDDVYERGSSAGVPADDPFRVPESTTQEVWAAYAEDGTPTAFCSQLVAEEALLQRSALDPETGALVIRAGEVQRGLPGPVYTLARLEASLTNGWASERSSLSTGRLVRDDTSLGRRASVIVVREPHRDDTPTTVAASGVVGGGSLESRVYFDAGSGAQFAREGWFHSDAGRETLVYRRVRTIETLPAADAEAACQDADAAES